MAAQIQPQALHSDLDQHDYNFSNGIYDESTDNAPFTDEEQHITDRHPLSQSALSRHSSVSSFPASVVHHTPTYERPTTPSRSPFYTARTTTPTHSSRPHSTGFRHPSSVRALQMQDEFESTDYEELTPGHRRRNSKLSHLSYRSSGSHHSSPTKSFRTSRSAHNSPNKTRLKQEFPLVLLHCTLLPPSMNRRAQQLKSEGSEKDLMLEAIIPEPYAKRWRTLQEKVVKNAEVKTRGVLIPHPRDEYELLEERLLESLELERPRIREGHYLSTTKPESETDSGFESGGTDTDSQHDEETEGNSSTKCPDCGHKLSDGIEAERKWEVKVFAANGLMRAGAWSAAWSEMEKVDVEVSIWMPEEVRREVDERLEALIAKELEAKPKREKKRRGIDDERAKEIYGDSIKPHDEGSGRSQAEIDGLGDMREATHQFQPQQQSNLQSTALHQTPVQPQPEPSTLLCNYIQLLAQDRRNIAIMLLSVLVLFYAFSNGQRTTPVEGVQSSMGPTADTVVSEIVVETTRVSTIGIDMAETVLRSTELTSTVAHSSSTTIFDAALPSENPEALMSLGVDIANAVQNEGTETGHDNLTMLEDEISEGSDTPLIEPEISLDSTDFEELDKANSAEAISIDDDGEADTIQEMITEESVREEL